MDPCFPEMTPEQIAASLAREARLEYDSWTRRVWESACDGDRIDEIQAQLDAADWAVRGAR